MNNVTLIDDLPTIEELEMPKSHGMTMIPQNEVNKFQKFIRHNGINTPSQSGMMSNSRYPKQSHDVMSNNTYGQQPRDVMGNNTYHKQPYDVMGNNMYRQQPPDEPNNLRDQMYEEIDFNPQLYRYHPPNDKYMDMHKNEKYNPYKIQENFDSTTTPEDKKEDKKVHNCVDIAEHTASCLVCSKLYGNNNILFIFLLVFLAFVNILLLKYVLESCKQS